MQMNSMGLPPKYDSALVNQSRQDRFYVTLEDEKIYPAYLFELSLKRSPPRACPGLAQAMIAPPYKVGNKPQNKGLSLKRDDITRVHFVLLVPVMFF